MTKITILHPIQNTDATLADLCGTGIQAAPVTLTSREIAKLTGKRHDNVIRDIRKMLKELESEGSSVLSYSYKSSTYQSNSVPSVEYVQYELNEDLTLTLVSGYSVKLRHAIVKRLRELEAMQTKTIALPSATVMGFEELLLLVGTDELRTAIEKRAAEAGEQLRITGEKLDEFDTQRKADLALRAEQLKERAEDDRRFASYIANGDSRRSALLVEHKAARSEAVRINLLADKITIC
jgi:phage regulator Rha-like protein